MTVLARFQEIRHLACIFFFFIQIYASTLFRNGCGVCFYCSGMQSVELALMQSVIDRYVMVFQGKKTYLISASKSLPPLTHSPLSAKIDRREEIWKTYPIATSFGIKKYCPDRKDISRLILPPLPLLRKVQVDLNFLFLQR